MVKFNYVEADQRLGEIVAKLQSTDISVDEALDLYKEGMELAEKIEDYLKTAEQSIKQIKLNLEKTSNKSDSDN